MTKIQVLCDVYFTPILINGKKNGRAQPPDPRKEIDPLVQGPN